MISVQEATEVVLSNLFVPDLESIPIGAALGRILAADILADTDLPPFDRVMMDGVAICFNDWRQGQREFLIAGIQKAGDKAKWLEEGKALEVTTGCICPQGADTVIPYEEITITENASIHAENAVHGKHIHLRGSDKKAGDIVLQKGMALNAAHLSIAASVGSSFVSVLKLPRVHIFSTGNELVDIAQQPGPHQIRRSNVYGLQFLLQKNGLFSTESHLNDDKAELKQALSIALDSNDIVLLSGGVSKGKFDFVPEVLKELGVEELFHRIAQKPGKPMWFGRKNNTLVFAFPGNPVSTLMCATRYLLPWMHQSLGQKPNRTRAILSEPFDNKGTLTFFPHVKTVINHRGELKAQLFSGNGSGDFASLSNANGFAEMPSDKTHFDAGEVVDVYLFD